MEYRITIVPGRQVPSPTLVKGIAYEIYALNLEEEQNHKPPQAFSVMVSVPRTEMADIWQEAIAGVLRIQFGMDCAVIVNENLADLPAQMEETDGENR